MKPSASLLGIVEISLCMVLAIRGNTVTYPVWFLYETTIHSNIHFYFPNFIQIWTQLKPLFWNFENSLLESYFRGRIWCMLHCACFSYCVSVCLSHFCASLMLFFHFSCREKEKKPKAPRTLITADGRVMNVNEPKYEMRNISITKSESYSQTGF